MFVHRLKEKGDERKVEANSCSFHSSKGQRMDEKERISFLQELKRGTKKGTTRTIEWERGRGEHNKGQKREV